MALEELAASGAAADRCLTWGEWYAASRAVAASLVAAGTRPGDAVASVAGNRILWPVADLGVLMAGAVSVGVYPTSAPTQVAQQLADCDAVAAIVDDAGQLAKVSAARAALPRLRTEVCEDGDAAAGAERVVAWEAWLGAGARTLRDAPGAASEVDRRSEARPGDVAFLIYTSGSTGEPKGARITHRYVSASAARYRSRLAPLYK